MLNLDDVSPLIDQIVCRIQKQSSCLTKIQASDHKKQTSYQQLLNSIAQLRGRSLFYPYVSSGLGQGAYVQLLDSSVKLDFICGIGPHILGHSHPELIRAALRGALEDTTMQGHLQMGQVYQELLQALLKIASKESHLKEAWLCPSGSMANENALKLIRQKHRGARKILAFTGAFAGRTSLMNEITDNIDVKVGLPTYNEVLRVPFCPKTPELALKALKQHWDKESKNIACFIIEPMQGDGGYVTATTEFLQPLLEFCKNHDICVWFDEVQTFCRSGEFFAFQKLQLGHYVDVCTIGKTLQMSATLWTKKYRPQPGLIAGTFSSSSSSFYTALEVLKQLQTMQGAKGRINKIYKVFLEKLQKLEQEDLIQDIDGWGLMLGVSLKRHADKIIMNQLLHKLFQKGLICFSCGKKDAKRLRFLIPAVAKEADLDQAIDILRQSLLEY